jgi:hypothetical protein
MQSFNSDAGGNFEELPAGFTYSNEAAKSIVSKIITDTFDFIRLH